MQGADRHTRVLVLAPRGPRGSRKSRDLLSFLNLIKRTFDFYTKLCRELLEIENEIFGYFSCSSLEMLQLVLEALVV